MVIGDERTATGRMVNVGGDPTWTIKIDIGRMTIVYSGLAGTFRANIRRIATVRYGPTRLITFVGGGDWARSLKASIQTPYYEMAEDNDHHASFSSSCGADS